MAAVVPSYKGFRYPVEVIGHCVWLYYQFPWHCQFGEVVCSWDDRWVDLGGGGLG
jgi:hypothetical protein